MLALEAEEGVDLTAALRAGRVFRDRSQAFVNLTTCEQCIQRMQLQTLKQLKDLQAERRARQEARKEEAMRYAAGRKAPLPQISKRVH